MPCQPAQIGLLPLSFESSSMEFVYRPFESINVTAARLNSSGFSRYIKWPASVMTTRFEPGMPASMAPAWACTSGMSASPARATANRRKNQNLLAPLTWLRIGTGKSVTSRPNRAYF